ncbi:hypothetical protein KCU68_g9, partial [Aureobasidium melanogenum]
LGDGDVSEKLVQLLVVADGKLKVTRDDTGLLVIASGVTGQLEDFGSQMCTDTLGVVALAEETVDTTDGESETGLGRTAEMGTGKARQVRRKGENGLAARLASSHFD